MERSFHLEFVYEWRNGGNISFMHENSYFIYKGSMNFNSVCFSSVHPFFHSLCFVHRKSSFIHVSKILKLLHILFIMICLNVLYILGLAHFFIFKAKTLIVFFQTTFSIAVAFMRVALYLLICTCEANGAVKIHGRFGTDGWVSKKL